MRTPLTTATTPHGLLRRPTSQKATAALLDPHSIILPAVPSPRPSTRQSLYRTQIQSQSKRSFLKPSTLTSVLGAAAAPHPPPARHLTHTRTIPYPRAAVFDTIIAVDRYPDFLPFVLSATVSARHDNSENRHHHQSYPTRARVKVGYETFGIEEDWESVVRAGYDEGGAGTGWIEAQSAENADGRGHRHDGVFDFLKARWELRDEREEGIPTGTGGVGTAVRLDLQLKFRSPIYDRLFAEVEGKVAGVMVGAFEERIRQLTARSMRA